MPTDRKFQSFLPCIWGDYFIKNKSSNLFHEKLEGWTTQRIADLKYEVRKLIINDDDGNILRTMNIIDATQLLGVDHHFKEEINQVLKRVLDVDVSQCGLHEVALHFRLLRQHGYYVPSDIFEKLKDENGNFMINLKDNPRDMLSLYNAAYMGTHEETILDEIITFTKAQLSSMLDYLEQPLRKQVDLSLESPIFRRMKRLTVRHYISIYEEEKNQIYEAILELAKLEFNLLQSHHQKELKDISLWWKNVKMTIKYPSFMRDRLVECYFWILGIYFEPQYSLARIITTKVIALISILDDIYDNYSTFEESHQLTKAIERWDSDAVSELPKYMKDYFLKLLTTFEEFEDMLSDGDKYRVSYLQNSMKTLAGAYFEEIKWDNYQNLPTLNDCLTTALMSTGYPTLVCASLVGMGDVATTECFKWATSFPRTIKASTIIARFMDDVTELEEVKLPYTIRCFMKEYNVTLNDASKKLREMIEGAWKDINEEWLNPTMVPRLLLESTINLTRMMETIYKHEAGYNNPIVIKDMITLLLIEPFPI